MNILVALLFSLPALYAEESPYLFAGKHFFASYLDCSEEALSDLEHLQEAMDHAVEASHATVLNKSSYTFEGSGFTALYLLSESHASIHTYPERGACFVDLFTCGNRCSAEDFHKELCAYLQPKEVVSRLFLRSEGVEELADFPLKP
ncbi:MAG: adenosylmethionine decarboxylase [Verrucomicrobiota bacterium]|nr:adenosylmethionine decarboxylase [Verrucomicrobiota bacterium]